MAAHGIDGGAYGDRIIGARQAAEIGPGEVAPIVMWSYLAALVKEYDAIVARASAIEAERDELREQVGAERLIHAIQEQGLREEAGKAPRWDEDGVVIAHGWLDGRCGRCGERLPVSLAASPTPTAAETKRHVVHSIWGQDPSGHCGCSDCDAPDDVPATPEPTEETP